MNEDNNKFMQEAARLSAEAIQHLDGGPFGCVIVKDGKVVGKGWNHVMATNDPTAHAEVMAIRDACKNLATPELVGCELYTSAEPCPMCMAAIYWACIPTVYYANTKEDSKALGYEDTIIYDELKKPLNERKIKMVHVPDEAAREVFDFWKKKNNPGSI
ncbi:MAG: nucleoside deaminase [Bacteroidetes bacterium]|nr:nucleoside deaminase [Bacteroidota bacterium]